jgi:3-dehydroquinate dehydratase type I
MGGVCVALGGLSARECSRALESIAMAELRLDLIKGGPEELAGLFSAHPGRHIATARPCPKWAEEGRAALLESCVDAGAGWVDVEIESGDGFIGRVKARARERGCRLIVSQHDFSGTLPRDELIALAEACAAHGPDLVKIVATPRGPAEVARLLSLYELPFAVLALGMGGAGAITRVAAPFLGAPFTFAAPDEGAPTAPGQLRESALRALLDALHGGEG